MNFSSFFSFFCGLVVKNPEKIRQNTEDTGVVPIVADFFSENQGV